MIKLFPSKIWKKSLPFIQRIKGIGIVLIISLMVSSSRKEIFVTNAELIVHFRAYVHGELLQMNKPYKNPFGESFEISRFRFYVGRVSPVYSDSLINSAQTSYRLIDFSDSATTIIKLPAVGGICNGIRFDIGIDSADQIKGAQSGPLDPIKGMYWTWNSGYQSFKLEGISPVSDQPGHLMAYHIGGYRYPNSTVWKIKMNTTNNELFRITNEYKIVIEVPLELDYFFDGPTPLRIKENASCTTPGEQARKLSENFVGSFTGLTLTSNP